MRGIRQIILLWFALGAVYLVLEGIWRGGWTHISMLVVGGLCGVLIGAVNQIPLLYNMRIVWQSLIGAAIVLVVELASGCIINIWWGWAIWDYSGRFGNVMGQICIPFAGLWFMLMPLAIWAEDRATLIIHAYNLYRGKPANARVIYDYSLLSIYRDLITGR